MTKKFEMSEIPYTIKYIIDWTTKRGRDRILEKLLERKMVEDIKIKEKSLWWKRRPIYDAFGQHQFVAIRPRVFCSFIKNWLQCMALVSPDCKILLKPNCILFIRGVFRMKRMRSIHFFIHCCLIWQKIGKNFDS